MDDQHLVVLRDLRDRREGLAGIVVAIIGDGGDHDERADVATQQRVAVGIGGRHRLGAEAAGGAGAVLDHDRLPEREREVLGEDARAHIDRTAGRKGDDELDRSRIGIGLRRRGRDGGGAQDEQENADGGLAQHGPHSTLMPVSLAIAAQRGASAAMKAAKSCGEPIFASAFRRSSPVCASFDLRMSLTAALSLATIGAGVPAGASSPDQNEAMSLGYPLSAVVGTSGSSGERAATATASARNRPPCTCGSRMAVVSKIICTCPATRSLTDCPAPR